ncbi:MAG: transcription-repair coupling factor, partial [Prevotella sp.]|nr:transcription-repair coupling factor [Prevotella sp.]
MDIQQLLSIFLKAPQTCAIEKILKDQTISTSFLKGLSGSAASVYFASLGQLCGNVFLFILNDTDEAGYFYHDLTQIIGKEKAMFFPSSYRRQVKYGQKDAANEILRTEVLSLLNARKNSHATATPVYIVTHPEAICELVVSERRLDERSIRLTTGECVDVNNMVRLMREFGFEEVDYVYEPGQFAMRGSIIDVYSYSNELPFRIDFFGDEIDSIRTFEVQSQLSKEKKQYVDIVPELAAISNERVPFTEFLPSDSVIVMRNTALVSDLVEQTYRNGFSTQAITERLNGATEMESHHIMQELRAESL